MDISTGTYRQVLLKVNVLSAIATRKGKFGCRSSSKDAPTTVTPDMPLRFQPNNISGLIPFHTVVLNTFHTSLYPGNPAANEVKVRLRRMF